MLQDGFPLAPAAWSPEAPSREALHCFGVGYSSLGYLRRLSVHSLKLDRSFVAVLGDSPKAVAIAKAARSLAHALGMSVAAEGVESAHQAAILRALGYDYAQGFSFARPLPVDIADRRIPEPVPALAS